MFYTVTVYTKVTEDECKILCSDFNWPGCNGDISCIFAVLTSQKGEDNGHWFMILMILTFGVFYIPLFSG